MFAFNILITGTDIIIIKSYLESLIQAPTRSSCFLQPHLSYLSIMRLHEGDSKRRKANEGEESCCKLNLLKNLHLEAP